MVAYLIIKITQAVLYLHLRQDFIMFKKLKYVVMAAAATAFLFFGWGTVREKVIELASDSAREKVIVLAPGENPLGLACPRNLLCIHTLDRDLSEQTGASVYKVHLYENLGPGGEYIIYTSQ